MKQINYKKLILPNIPYSTKTGKTFDGVVLLADTGGKYVNFRVEQNRK